MQKARLKRLRTRFRENVFERDGHTCIFCNADAVDAHHITDRSEMPNDGYVLENGASLCEKHHLMAEQFHISGGTFWFKGFHPSDLYRMISSSYDRAVEASNNLGDE